MRITEKEFLLNFYDCLDDFDTLKSFWKYIGSLIDFQAIENPVEVLRYTRKYYNAMKGKCPWYYFNSINVWNAGCVHRREFPTMPNVCPNCRKKPVDITNTKIIPQKLVFKEATK